jgi:hypothetical protein
VATVAWQRQPSFSRWLKHQLDPILLLELAPRLGVPPTDDLAPKGRKRSGLQSLRTPIPTTQPG